jgi:ABC-2 type transport system ATP-binding protein
MTGRENLRYTARLNGLDAAAAERRIAELLDRVGLCHAADARVDTYSRGMRQRLGIADALVKDPRVLILDEPTVAIDPEGVAEILALIRAVADERGATVLLSSHLLHQVQSVCDRVAIFVDGRKVAEGSVPELASRLGAGPATVEVTVEGEDGTIEATLRDVVGVREVERDPGEPGRWRLAAEGDVRPRIAEALVRRGLALRSLHRREDELDVLYRRYFRDAETRDGREARDGR